MAMVTLTAPGKAVLHDAEAMRAWNEQAPAMWRETNRAAQQTVKRAYGQTADYLAKSWETQKRGAWHAHVAVGARNARGMTIANAYARALEVEWQVRDGGWVDGGRRTWRSQGLRLLASEHAGRYMAKYMSAIDKSSGKLTVSETVLRRDVPGHLVYVSRKLTNKTGVTMRSIRWKRVCWVLGYDPKTGEVDPSRDVANNSDG